MAVRTQRRTHDSQRRCAPIAMTDLSDHDAAILVITMAENAQPGNSHPAWACVQKASRPSFRNSHRPIREVLRQLSHRPPQHAFHVHSGRWWERDEVRLGVPSAVVVEEASGSIRSVQRIEPGNQSWSTQPARMSSQEDRKTPSAVPVEAAPSPWPAQGAATADIDLSKLPDSVLYRITKGGFGTPRNPRAPFTHGIQSEGLRNLGRRVGDADRG